VAPSPQKSTIEKPKEVKRKEEEEEEEKVIVA